MLAQDGGGLSVAEGDDLPALLELAQEEHVVDQLGHLENLLSGLPQEALQIGAGQLGRVEEGLQPSERRSQLVGNRRSKRRAECFVVWVRH
jgi:hypothetical protein